MAQKITLLDGGMGQELVARSAHSPTPLWSTSILREEPHLVRAVHDEFFAVGAVVATTASYSIHRDRLAREGWDDYFADGHTLACEIACASRDAHGAGLVAGSMGPLGWSYRPDLAPPPEQAAPLYAEIAALQAPFVDFHILETMSGIDQARGALMGAQTSDKPVWLAVSVLDDDGTKLRSGEAVADILQVVKEMRPAALLVNCSTPEAVTQALPLLAQARVPLGAYANGFVNITTDYAKAGETVDRLRTRTDLGPSAYADFTDKWRAAGATIIGGCCEVSPAHIAEVSQRIHGH